MINTIRKEEILTNLNKPNKEFSNPYFLVGKMLKTNKINPNDLTENELNLMLNVAEYVADFAYDTLID